MVSPIAVGRKHIINALRSNVSADAKIERFSCAGLPFRNGAEVKADLSRFSAQENQIVQDLCKLDRKMELLVSAYQLAEQRLQKLITLTEPSKTGVILGVGAEVLPLKENEDHMIRFIQQRQNAVNELIFTLNRDSQGANAILNPYDIYSLYLADKFRASAFQRSILTACVSSTQAVAFAYDAICRKEAEVVIAGGTDSILNLIALISFGKLGVIPETNEGVHCKPFDQNRKGTVAGEAAGFLILASDEFVQRNQLQPLASICGYGNTLDGYKITAPDPEGTAMKKAMQMALTNSSLTPQDIDYYYAHGTGTRQNDGVELKALEEVLGKHSSNIPISSTKDRHGHAIAAAGNQELSILLEMMQHNFLPGNMNLQHPISEKMNLMKENTEKEIRYALSSNFAFGGINTVLAIENQKKWS